MKSKPLQQSFKYCACFVVGVAVLNEYAIFTSMYTYGVTVTMPKRGFDCGLGDVTRVTFISRKFHVKLIKCALQTV